MAGGVPQRGADRIPLAGGATESPAQGSVDRLALVRGTIAVCRNPEGNLRAIVLPLAADNGADNATSPIHIDRITTAVATPIAPNGAKRPVR